MRIDPKTDSIGSEHKGVAHRRVLNPLDTAALEQHMLHSTQLLEVRPPIEPAASGDDFVRVIPFQILSWLPRCELSIAHLTCTSALGPQPQGLPYPHSHLATRVGSTARQRAHRKVRVCPC